MPMRVASSRRAIASAVEDRSRSARTGSAATWARNLGRRRRARLHAALQQGGQAIERRDLEIVDVNAPLLAQDFEECICGVGSDVEAQGSAFPARRIELGGAGRNACFPLPSQ